MSDDHHHDAEPIPQRTLDAAADGCEESRLFISRRAFLGASATFSAWAFAPRISNATPPGEEPRLLVVLLQGGMDGLQIAVPKDDPAYYAARGDLALHADHLLPLPGSSFGLNTSMPNLQSLYASGQAAIIHAIAPPLRIGSHFECMYNLETGLPGQLVRSSTTGWLNRLLTEVPAGHPVSGRGGMIGCNSMIMAGPAPIMSWRPGGWGRANMQAYQPTADMYKLYTGDDYTLAATLERGARTNMLAHGGSSSSAKSTLEQAFWGAGVLLGAADGPRVAAMGFAGFDTHVTENKSLSSNLSSIDTGLKLFKEAIGPAAWAKTVVVCCSEFGRTVYNNGRDGTDHGVGGISFVLGGAVNGRKVVTDWPGLGQSQMQGGCLRATTDTRAVFKGILQDHLGVPRSLLDTRIFPESQTLAPIDGLIAASSQSTSAAAAAMAAAAPVAPSPARSTNALEAFRRANGAS